jgi:hypothetical protein
MATKAHFRVVARMDSPVPRPGTVTIHRRIDAYGRPANLFEVRPYRRRRTFELPLSTVADMVVARIIRAEVLEKRRKKRGA